MAQQITEQIAKPCNTCGRHKKLSINLWSEPSATLNVRDSLVPPADNLRGSLVFKICVLIPGIHSYSAWKQSTANSFQSHNLSFSSHSSYFSLYNTNLAAWIYICEPVFQLSRWGFGIYGYWQIFARRFEVFTSVEDYCIVLIHCYISGWSIGVSRNGILRLQFVFGFFFVVVQACCENWWRVYILCVVCVSCVLYSKFSSDWLAACFIVGFFLKVIHPHFVYSSSV